VERVARAVKRYAPADCSSTGAYRWCSHLANVSKVAPATVGLVLRLGFDFQQGGLLLVFDSNHIPKMHRS